LPLGRVLAGGVDRRAGRAHSAAVRESAGWRQRSGARAWQGDDRRVAFDRVQSQVAVGSVGEQQRAVGQVLQRCRLDGVFVAALPGLGVAPVRAAGLRPPAAGGGVGGDDE
jgi:hypothetical protein